MSASPVASVAVTFNTTAAASAGTCPAGHRQHGDGAVGPQPGSGTQPVDGRPRWPGVEQPGMG
ncbi:MAG: hypothetical protein R2749_30615 [Acidimicrobiales bacterium]